MLRNYYNSIKTKDMKSFDEITEKAKQLLEQEVGYTSYKFLSNQNDMSKLLIETLTNYKNNKRILGC
jgi:ribonucleotide reductase beta subunit family protein with ferritin-like domain